MPDRSLELIQNSKDVAVIAKTLSQATMIAFDTEFIRESTFYPKLEILQIATPSDAWLIDCQALSKNEMKPILDVFQDPKILKIVHAAHGDQECLLSAYDILSSPVFDTAVGASLCGLGDNIGLGNLIRSVLGIELPKGYARTNWSKRPLPKPVLEYALLDVKHLIEVAGILFERLDQNGRRAWAMELSAKFGDRKLYEVPPEDIARRLAQSGKFHVRDYAVLLELVKWREDRVRELDVPRRWLAEDGVLIDLAKIKPTTVEQLQGFRGLSRGEAKLPQAKKILSAIEKGVKNKDEIPKDLKERKTLQPNSEESLGIDLLRVVLSLLSEQYSIASKHIVQPQNVLPLLRLHPDSVAVLQTSGLVSPQLGDAGMQRLFAFLKGDLSLALESGKRVKLRQ
ncbi:MAG: HRDC domain-containing protein [Bdellovibrionales bacterium]|nr:HRDC domain-containing protein [Bdellovibrionales bacterium]